MKPSASSTRTAIRHISRQKVNEYLIHIDIGLHSSFLARNVNIDLFQPAFMRKNLPVLLLNDGQDARLLKLHNTLTDRYQSNAENDVIVVGIHAGDRMHEYGVAHIPDYKGRGSKAASYENFIKKELLPFLYHQFGIKLQPQLSAFAGFSLGGLSAIDLVWRNPDLFSRAGVFSGSLWWRKKSLTGGYEDSDRIMHALIAAGPKKNGLRFWFQAGTCDETADRNNNGVIDVIDDTLDLIEKLRQVGYSDKDIRYVQVEGGEHNFNTWSEVFPNFVQWAFDENNA